MNIHSFKECLGDVPNVLTFENQEEEVLSCPFHGPLFLERYLSSHVVTFVPLPWPFAFGMIFNLPYPTRELGYQRQIHWWWI